MKYLLCIIILINSLIGFTQSLNYYTFEQIDGLQRLETRPIVIFIHTDWCKYCQNMKNTTFQNEQIIEILNKQFYFVDLNGEEKRSITFQNHTFHYKPTGHNTGVHALAAALGTIDGTLSYPALCILNQHNEIIFQYNAFLDAKTLQKILDAL